MELGGAKRKRTTADFEGHPEDNLPMARQLPQGSAEHVIVLPEQDSIAAINARNERIQGPGPFGSPTNMTYVNRNAPRLPTAAYPVSWRNMVRTAHTDDLSDPDEVESFTGDDLERIEQETGEKTLAIEYYRNVLPRNQFPKNEEDVNNIIINLENSDNEDERKYIEPLRKFKPRLMRLPPRGSGRTISRFENFDEYTDRIQIDIDYYNNDLDRRLRVSGFEVVNSVRGGKTKKRRKIKKKSLRKKRKTKKKTKRKSLKKRRKTKRTTK